jgi:effector-binding domain-containing protein
VSPEVEVVLRTVAASPTAVVAESTTWEEFPRVWGTLLDEVYEFVRAGGTNQTGHNVMLYRSDLPDVEVGVQVEGPFAPSGRVVPSELPGGRVATAVHRGSYHELGATHAAVRTWCAAHDVALTSTRWEIYGDWRDDPAELETEVNYLLA